jgi:hypothetical protein
MARQATRLVESIPWNRFLGSLDVYKFGLWLAGMITLLAPTDFAEMPVQNVEI